MTTTLQKTNWQNEYISKQHVISLLLSCTIVFLIILIPFKPKQFNIIGKHLKISLSKEKLLERPSQVEKIRNNSKIKPLTNQKIQPTVTSKIKIPTKTNKPVKKIQKITTLKPKKPLKVLPSSLEILNSIKNYKPLEEVSLEFQAKNDKFIYKNIIKPKEKKLIVENKLAKNINVDNPDSLLTASAKKALGFFSAIDEPEKTVDSIPFCPLLGIRTFNCPGRLF